MRSIELAPGVAESIREHARADYPHECCGFLIARADRSAPGSDRLIVEIERALNRYGGPTRGRFAIAPRELLDLEARLAARNRVVAGFYHSHPDRPARPSVLDQARAWPWYAYLLVSVTSAGARDLRAFELDASSRLFRSLRLRAGAAPRRPTENVSAVGAR